MMSKIQLLPGMRVDVTGERQTNLCFFKYFKKKNTFRHTVQTNNSERNNI